MSKQLTMFDDFAEDLTTAKIARTTDKPTSQTAASEIEPKLAGLRVEFVRLLKQIGRPATAQEVAALAGGAESIRKRALECVRMGAVKECGTKTCEVTGKQATAYVVGI